MKKVLFALILCLGCLPLSAQAQASASLNFRVIVPRFVELTDSHPEVTSLVVNHELRLRTSLALTCVHVMNKRPVRRWNVSALTDKWTAERINGGYMFCTTMTGKLNVVFTYELDSEGEPWPFETSLQSI